MARKTAAERQKLRRERLKAEGKYEQYKAKDRARKQFQRSKLTDIERQTLRVKNCEYKQAQRNRERQSNCEGSVDSASSSTTPTTTRSSVFANKQSLGKARKRLWKALPKSPRKRIALLSEVAKQHGVNQNIPVKKCATSSLSEVVKNAVIAFYNDNETSWQAPGKKDFVIVREMGDKRHVQKRFLLTTLKEAHSVFVQMNPDMKIGFSKFAELRPTHVLLQKDIPHSVCLCKHHENVKELLICLKRNNVSVESDFHSFISQIVCDPDSEDCMMGNCDGCRLKVEEVEPDDDIGGEMCRWFEWTSGDVEKVERKGTVYDCFQTLKNFTSSFLEHTYIKRKQAKIFRELTQNTPVEQVVIQIDFSENYSCKQQNKIQSAHWTHKQITVVTAVAWYTVNGVGNKKSFAFVTEYMQHDKYCVYTCLRRLLREMKKVGHFKTVNFFSDGAASQFKQKFNFCNLCNIGKEFDVKVNWHFFATSHGKGAVDGVGGEVKRIAWHAVLSGRCTVMNAENFVECVQEKKNTKTVLILLDEKEIDNDKREVDERCNGINPVPNTRKLHFLTVVSDNPTTIQFANHSELPSCEWFTHEFKNKNEEGSGETEAIPVGLQVEREKYYAVFYDQTFYLGRVIDNVNDNSEVKMKFLKQTFPGEFQWPSKDDVDVIDKAFVFFGPLTLQGTGPFLVKEIEDIRAAYKKIKKQ